MSFKAKSASTFRTKPTTKKSNVALLTEGASYIRRANKAGRGEPVVEKVVFDDDARREYLTGFSKRKKAKIEEKRERAKKKDHEDHLAMRRKVSR
jgi:ribosomal RNA-processing protein 17